eukprot:TRINITY_DN29297_c0_g1_i1.p1 TRINITY_DN29297_c0_g1~~TRINITY_DN29297_c0_g1_i1.p1  ORF type:complete len:1542 (+),score=258.49 TRINITY_DN29297_c0_g1_i1:62-4627(+)
MASSSAQVRAVAMPLAGSHMSWRPAATARSASPVQLRSVSPAPAQCGMYAAHQTGAPHGRSLSPVTPQMPSRLAAGSMSGTLPSPVWQVSMCGGMVPATARPHSVDRVPLGHSGVPPRLGSLSPVRGAVPVQANVHAQSPSGFAFRQTASASLPPMQVAPKAPASAPTVVSPSVGPTVGSPVAGSALVPPMKSSTPSPQHNWCQAAPQQAIAAASRPGVQPVRPVPGIPKVPVQQASVGSAALPQGSPRHHISSATLPQNAGAQKQVGGSMHVPGLGQGIRTNPCGSASASTLGVGNANIRGLPAGVSHRRGNSFGASGGGGSCGNLVGLGASGDNTRGGRPGTCGSRSTPGVGGGVSGCGDGGHVREASLGSGGGCNTSGLSGCNSVGTGCFDSAAAGYPGALTTVPIANSGATFSPAVYHKDLSSASAAMPVSPRILAADLESFRELGTPGVPVCSEKEILDHCRDTSRLVNQLAAVLKGLEADVDSLRKENKSLRNTMAQVVPKDGQIDESCSGGVVDVVNEQGGHVSPPSGTGCSGGVAGQAFQSRSRPPQPPGSRSGVPRASGAGTLRAVASTTSVATPAVTASSGSGRRSQLGRHSGAQGSATSLWTAPLDLGHVSSAAATQGAVMTADVTKLASPHGSAHGSSSASVIAAQAAAPSVPPFQPQLQKQSSTPRGGAGTGHTMSQRPTERGATPGSDRQRSTKSLGNNSTPVKGVGSSTSYREVWSVDQKLWLGKEWETIESHLTKKSVRVLDGSAAVSVTQAAEELNSEAIKCPEDMCVVYSPGAEGYYLLFRRGRGEEAASLMRDIQAANAATAALAAATIATLQTLPRSKPTKKAMCPLPSDGLSSPGCATPFPVEEDQGDEHGSADEAGGKAPSTVASVHVTLEPLPTQVATTMVPVDLAAQVEACARRGDAEGAEEFLSRMLREGVEPTGAVFDAVVASLEQKGESAKAEAWVTQALDKGITPNDACFEVAMLHAVRQALQSPPGQAQQEAAGRVEDLMGKLLQVTVPKKEFFNTTIRMFAELRDAAKVETWLLKAGQSGWTPEQAAFDAVVLLFAEANPFKSEEWLSRALQTDYRLSDECFEAVVRAFCRMGAAAKANGWLARMHADNRDSSAETIYEVANLAAEVNDLQHAEAWLGQLSQRKTEKSVESLRRDICDAALSSGDVACAERQMEALEGAEPERTSRLVTLCAQNGDPNRAKGILERYRLRGGPLTPEISASILAACAVAGDADGAEAAARAVFASVKSLSHDQACQVRQAFGDEDKASRLLSEFGADTYPAPGSFAENGVVVTTASDMTTGGSGGGPAIEVGSLSSPMTGLLDTPGTELPVAEAFLVESGSYPELLPEDAASAGHAVSATVSGVGAASALPSQKQVSTVTSRPGSAADSARGSNAPVANGNTTSAQAAGVAATASRRAGSARGGAGARGGGGSGTSAGGASSPTAPGVSARGVSAKGIARKSGAVGAGRGVGGNASATGASRVPTNRVAGRVTGGAGRGTGDSAGAPAESS